MRKTFLSQFGIRLRAGKGKEFELREIAYSE